MDNIGKASSALFTGSVYAFTCLKAWAGTFSVGSVTPYVGAVTALSGNISLLLKSINSIRNNAPFLQATYEFQDLPNAMYQGSLTTEKRSDREYQVEFKEVSFVTLSAWKEMYRAAMIIHVPSHRRRRGNSC